MTTGERFREAANRILWKIAVSGAVLLIAALIAGGLYYRSHPAKQLSEKDTVVLAEFVNTTGGPVFDAALRQGLSAQLEQSPFLNLLPDQRIAQTLCELVEVRDLADADGFPCRRTASKECFDCGTELCSDHAEQCGVCHAVFCPACLSFHQTEHPKPATADSKNVRERKTA